MATSTRDTECPALARSSAQTVGIAAKRRLDPSTRASRLDAFPRARPASLARPRTNCDEVPPGARYTQQIYARMCEDEARREGCAAWYMLPWLLSSRCSSWS